VLTGERLMTPDEATAWLSSPSGVAAVEAGARASLAHAGRLLGIDGDELSEMPAYIQCNHRDRAKAVLSAVLVGGLLIPKEET
jgi:hypothetical protein